MKLIGRLFYSMLPAIVQKFWTNARELDQDESSSVSFPWAYKSVDYMSPCDLNVRGSDADLPSDSRQNQADKAWN